MRMFWLRFMLVGLMTWTARGLTAWQGPFGTALSNCGNGCTEYSKYETSTHVSRLCFYLEGDFIYGVRIEWSIGDINTKYGVPLSRLNTMTQHCARVRNGDCFTKILVRANAYLNFVEIYKRSPPTASVVYGGFFGTTVDQRATAPRLCLVGIRCRYEDGSPLTRVSFIYEDWNVVHPPPNWVRVTPRVWTVRMGVRQNRRNEFTLFAPSGEYFNKASLRFNDGTDLSRSYLAGLRLGDSGGGTTSWVGRDGIAITFEVDSDQCIVGVETRTKDKVRTMQFWQQGPAEELALSVGLVGTINGRVELPLYCLYGVRGRYGRRAIHYVELKFRSRV